MGKEPVPEIKSFAQAEAWLAKTNRPKRLLERNTRLRRVDADTIAVQLHQTDIVVFQRNTELVTIDTGKWITNVTRDRICRYSPARIYPKGKTQEIWHPDDPRKPAKMQKCRTCKQTGFDKDGTCGGGKWCHIGYDYEAHQFLPCACGHTESHQVGTCEHGQVEHHAWPEKPCYRCQGTGVADYGSQTIHFAWDGSPLQIDDTGKVIGACDGFNLAPTGPGFKPKLSYKTVAPKHAIGGSRIVGALAEAIPAVNADVRFPCKCTKNNATLPLHQMVVHLNDGCRWSREEVADWLDTLDLDLRFQPIPA